MMQTALIVSHGQPSDPDPAEAGLALLAARVSAFLPGWRVRSATLAKPGALAAAVEGAAAGLVYPMFMAGGWFPTVELPRRMAEAGAAGWSFLPPFGIDEAVQALALRLTREAAADLGQAAQETPVLLAAHGSFRSAAPSAVAQALAEKMRRAGFARAEAYFIDQEPRIASASGFGPGSVCLPFFAAEGGHVADDLPAALTEAGFGGRVLAPMGLAPEVPGLIAAALREAAARMG
ncbi:cobalamin biosynthesis protein CbiX [bacterium]|nr:cobalamin biosynthesis protein CbiX [bacterium]